MLDHHDEEENSTAIDSLVNEDNFIDQEMPMDPNTDENFLNSEQPAGISDEIEFAPSVEMPCHQIESFIADVNAECSIGSNEHSDAQDQNSIRSCELVASSNVNSFEPNEKSTPRLVNGANDDGNIKKTPCRSLKEEHKKVNLQKAVQNRTVSGYFYQIPKSSISNKIQTFMFSFAAKST